MRGDADAGIPQSQVELRRLLSVVRTRRVAEYSQDIKAD